VLSAVLCFCAIAPVAAGQGGFFPVAWGWMGIGFAWVGVTGLLLRRQIQLSPAELVMAAGILLVTLWTAAGLLWTSSVTNTVLEVERALAYLAFVAAVMIVCQRSSAIGVLVGTWAAIMTTSLYSLATHLAPERFGFYQDPLAAGRLFQPIGYWNALGIFCAMGIALALGLTDRSGASLLRCATAASIAPLAATTYFTFSRGAWIAVAVAIAAVIALSPTRLRYLVTALVVLPAPAVAIAYAASLPQLTAANVQPAQVAAPGARAALAVSVAAAIAGAASLALSLAQRRLVVSPRSRQAFAGLLIGLTVLVAVAGVARYGSPIEQARHAYRSLTAPPPASQNLNNRLLSLSLNGRQDLWRAASHQFRAHPVGGGGPGTYGSYWLAHRPSPVDYVADAHSLYLETLAEQGIVGLAALLLVLVPPLVVAVRFRATPAVPIGLGAYVAYLVHAAVDWDWEVSAVTLVALAAGLAVVISTREAPAVLPWSTRVCAATVLVAVGAVSAIGLVANRALSDGMSALARADTAAALTDAHRAKTFAPWSDAPDLVSGRAQLQDKHTAAAASSFRAATRKEPTDWQAWQWLARATTGSEHARAVETLKSLDPGYDFVNGRP
jgi:O-antigen ligase